VCNYSFINLTQPFHITTFKILFFASRQQEKQTEAVWSPGIVSNPAGFAPSILKNFKNRYSELIKGRENYEEERIKLPGVCQRLIVRPYRVPGAYSNYSAPRADKHEQQ
jgi:hypothetical protein